MALDCLIPIVGQLEELLVIVVVDGLEFRDLNLLIDFLLQLLRGLALKYLAQSPIVFFVDLSHDN